MEEAAIDSKDIRFGVSGSGLIRVTDKTNEENKK